MKRERIEQVMLAGVLSALAVALGVLEGWLPPLPIPGARFGLSNIVVMFALRRVSFPCAGGVLAVKVLFALLRGPIACLMSAAGGVLSLLAMTFVDAVWRDKLSFVGIGVLGALAHNVGQWCAAYGLLGTAMIYYAPLLLLLAVPVGLITGLLLNVVAPYLERVPLVRKG